MEQKPPATRVSAYNGTLEDLAHYSHEQIFEYYRLMADYMPLLIVLFSVEGDTYRIICANAPTRVIAGFTTTFMKTIDEAYKGEELVNLHSMFAECKSTKQIVTRELQLTIELEDIEYWTSTTVIPIPDNTGQITHILSYSQDISERKRQEHEQSLMLIELSTPMLSISSTTVVVPLIGTMDTYRVQHLNNTLLQGIASLRVQNLILDITGVPVVDTQVANALIQAAQSVRLLGARVVLCGIRPEVAQVLVGLGINFSQMPTYASLQSAISNILQENENITTSTPRI
jgi:anti-anti-sigma factor